MNPSVTSIFSAMYAQASCIDTWAVSTTLIRKYYILPAATRRQHVKTIAKPGTHIKAQEHTHSPFDTAQV